MNMLFLPNFLHISTRTTFLDPHQSGFRAGRSTETALLAFTEELHVATAASFSSVVILLDLTAAFDTVNRQILLSTLQQLGVSSAAFSLFTSSLKDRTYRGTWRRSEPCNLTSGFPEGSVLGPIVIHSHGISYRCSTTSGGYIHPSPRGQHGFWSGLLGSLETWHFGECAYLTRVRREDWSHSHVCPLNIRLHPGSNCLLAVAIYSVYRHESGTDPQI